MILGHGGLVKISLAATNIQNFVKVKFVASNFLSLVNQVLVEADI